MFGKPRNKGDDLLNRHDNQRVSQNAKMHGPQTLLIFRMSDFSDACIRGAGNRVGEYRKNPRNAVCFGHTIDDALFWICAFSINDPGIN
jgi:hypothetical protein